MFTVVIKKELTCIFNGVLNDGIDSYRDDMVGFFINSHGIKELIDSIPVGQFYINDLETPYRKVTKEQAFFLYDEILKYIDENQNQKKK